MWLKGAHCLTTEQQQNIKVGFVNHLSQSEFKLQVKSISSNLGTAVQW